MLIQRSIFTVLGTVLYLCAIASGNEETITINGSIGDHIDFDMPSPTNATRCIVTSNTGLEFSLIPDIFERPSGILQSYTQGITGTCGMRIMSATAEHGGQWTIEAYVESNGVENITVGRFFLQFTDSDGNVEPQAEQSRRVDVFPARMISVFSGYSISLRLLNHYENLTSCIATSPDGQEFNVSEYVDNVSNDIRPFDQCGVTARVNTNHTGTWRLDATIENDEDEKLTYFGTFYVLVQNSSAINAESTVTYLQRGTSTSLMLGPSGAVSCQLRSPTGEIFPIQTGSCHIDIPIVTHAHEGYWFANYSLNGRMDTVQIITHVIVYDSHSSNAMVTYTNNGQINLLCSVQAYSFSFCQFIHPDGDVMNVFEGIGNDRYLYYGNGTASTSMLTKRTHQCGITILKAHHDDFGMWKCILGADSEMTGSLLDVYSHGNNRPIVVSEFEPTVYVLKGDSFTVKCKANTILKYCWIGSPNGTAYSVSSIVNSPRTLLQAGMGLAMGECGAVIPAAEYTDEGDWYCGMGLSDIREARSTVPVIVTDTMLAPIPRNVTVRENEVKLSCYLIPGHYQSIDYCRWIMPSESGVQTWESSRRSGQISYYKDNRMCSLKISIARQPSYIGEWTCVAGLVGSIEVSATVRVLEDPQFANTSTFKSWCFGLGLGMISIIFAFSIIVMVRNKLRLKEKTGLPPQYTESQMRMPPAMTPHA